MNPDPIQELRDTLLRRELTPDEERLVSQWLARHPEAAPGWHADLAVARELRRLPDVPVSADFTRRILAEVGRPASEVTLASRGTVWDWLRVRWVPGLGFAVALVAVSLAGWQSMESKREADVTRQLVALRTLSDLPPAVLEDFEAIRGYAAGSAPVDFGLLAALE